MVKHNLFRYFSRKTQGLIMPEILIIDDDLELFQLLDQYLKAENFSCRHAALPKEGMALLGTGGFDAVILDVMMPEMNGFEVLNRIRTNKQTADLPVLMLTARGEDIDRIIGLEMGADDYMGKPFNPRELVARLRSILRRSSVRSEQNSNENTTIDDIIVNQASLSVTVNGVKQRLAASEIRLLLLLAQNTGQVMSREHLCRTILGRSAYPQDRSLDMMISRLRRKLGLRDDGSERIVAVRGEGYIYLAREA